MLRRKKLLITITAILLMLCFAIGGTFAYLTYRTDKITNTISLGEIKIELTETEWTSLKDENENSVPDIAEYVFPGQIIPKNPKVENTGKNNAFVYLKVTVPKKSVRYINENNQIIEADSTKPKDLFTYEINNEWFLFMSDTSNTDYNEYYYYYNNELSPSSSTPTLFDEIVTLDIIEGQIDELTTSVTVNAYGIQADYKEEKNDVLSAWNHLAKQQGLKLYSGDSI